MASEGTIAEQFSSVDRGLGKVVVDLMASHNKNRWAYHMLCEGLKLLYYWFDLDSNVRQF